MTNRWNRTFRPWRAVTHPDVGAGSSPIEFHRAREAYETLAASDRHAGTTDNGEPVAVERTADQGHTSD
jgi:hypothetical protein